MGSDSRTGTASSNARPSWRDRHLSQLSDEQLGEVNQHRGSEEVSIPEMAGVESESSTILPSTQATSAKLPRPQAGPARDDRLRSNSQDSYRQRQTEDARSDENGYQGSAPGGVRNQHEESRYNSADSHLARDARDQEHRGYQDPRRADSYHPVGDSQGRDQRVHRTEQNRSPEQDRYEPSGRYPRDGHVEARYENRYDTRSDYAAEGTASRPGTAAEVVPENKKSFVDKVLDFKLPGPVKYSLMALAIAVMVAVSLLKPIDNSSQSQLESAFVRASIGFGLARALNGVISVAQGTEFAVQPAGVGVNFSPGEILDPINDLVERFSWVMLLATSSIGIQQILLQISSWAGISVLLAGAGLFFLLTRLRNSSINRMADFAGKLLLAMLLVRFLIPVGSLANDWVYKQFLQPQYEESTAGLEVARERIKEISTRQADVAENDGSITDRAKKLYSSMTSKFDFDGMLDDYKQSAETVSENAINLIVVFVLQTIIFPLLFMYLIYRLFRFALIPSRSPR